MAAWSASPTGSAANWAAALTKAQQADHGKTTLTFHSGEQAPVTAVDPEVGAVGIGDPDAIFWIHPFDIASIHWEA